MKVNIKEACHVLGVSPDTLRRWHKSGKLIPDLTSGGHRRYDLASLKNLGKRNLVPSQKKTICYARVSTHDQKEDLKRQSLLLETYCAANGWSFELIEDLGSGINFNKKGLVKLLNLIMNDEVERLVLTNKDRLLRFGSELIFTICENQEIEVVLINKSSENQSFEEELVSDVLEIITVFSARMYGKRSHKTKKLMESMTNELSQSSPNEKI